MTVKERYTGIQDILKTVGSDGCYLLSLCSIAEEYMCREVDLIGALKTALKKGWLSDDMTVLDPCAVLAYLCPGTAWTVEKSDALPDTVPDEMYTVAVWENGGYKHFRRRGFDTLWDSNTVKNGKITGWRLLTVREAR